MMVLIGNGKNYMFRPIAAILYYIIYIIIYNYFSKKVVKTLRWPL